MEEKKTKRIDLVVIMAILILIAFIGVMSFAMVQGIMQYTKKDEVAYADEDPSSFLVDNMLRVSSMMYMPDVSGSSVSLSGGSSSYRDYSYGVDSTASNYPLYSVWVYNTMTSNISYNFGSRFSDRQNLSTNKSFKTGFKFILLNSIISGNTYTFSFFIRTSYNYAYSLVFYSYDVENDTYTFIGSGTTGYNSDAVKNVTFTSSANCDVLYVDFTSYNNSTSQSQNETLQFRGCSLCLGNTLRDASYFNTILYTTSYSAGYYTGYAAASPSDDEAQLDLVGNNLFEYQFNQPWDDSYAKLVRNGDTYKGWQVHASGSAMYNYDEVNSLSIFKYYGSSVSYNYDFYYYLDDFDSGDYTFSFNYDYGDIDAHDFKLLALTFTIPETDPESEETLAYIQDDNADVTLTATYYQGRYLISISCMLSSTADLICRYAKLETGSNFTGFVPLDYYNYGYNQGYQNGQGDLLGSRNYILLDYLAFYGSTRNLTSDFVFNNTNYVYGDWTEDINSVYNYNNPNFAIIDSLDGAPSGSQVGYKYENENLYGDILLMMPYCDDNLRVVFEVVDSGEVLITSPRDTVHWSLNSHLGNVNGQASWSCDLYTIHFYSPTQVNIYFLPYQPLDYGTEALYLPLNTKSWRLYSTQTNTALSSFDDGYLNGLEQGKEQQAEQDATLIARARGQGYEEGRRDALEDANDYSFMGLIGSVIDAPIASFRGLLNFSILGVNMQSFVLALLTLSVIIIVIKIALGGK